VVQLRRKIGGGLIGKRGIALADAASVVAMTGGAGHDSPVGIAPVVQAGDSRSAGRLRKRLGACRDRGDRHRGIVRRDLLARWPVEMVGDPHHLRMPALPLREEFELARNIAGVKAGEARHQVSVALAPEPVAGYAGPARARVSAAERDEFAGPLEPAHAAPSRTTRQKGRESADICDGNLRRARRVPDNKGNWWVQL
jgi:hypothetical protein